MLLCAGLRDGRGISDAQILDVAPTRPRRVYSNVPPVEEVPGADLCTRVDVDPGIEPEDVEGGTNIWGAFDRAGVGWVPTIGISGTVE